MPSPENTIDAMKTRKVNAEVEVDNVETEQSEEAENEIDFDKNKENGPDGEAHACRKESETDHLFVDKDHKTLTRVRANSQQAFQKMVDAKKPSCLENMTPFILLIGLGTHSIFEGLALGLTKNLRDLFMFVVAVCLHKGAAGMSLGISMA